MWKNEFPKFCALLLLCNIVFASGCNNHDITISIIINNSYLKLWKATPWTIKHSIVINDILLLSQKNVSECVPSEMSLLILQMYTHIILLLNWSSAWAMMNLTCISFYFYWHFEVKLKTSKCKTYFDQQYTSFIVFFNYYWYFHKSKILTNLK